MEMPKAKPGLVGEEAVGVIPVLFLVRVAPVDPALFSLATPAAVDKRPPPALLVPLALVEKLEMLAVPLVPAEPGSTEEEEEAQLVAAAAGVGETTVPAERQAVLCQAAQGVPAESKSSSEILITILIAAVKVVAPDHLVKTAHRAVPVSPVEMAVRDPLDSAVRTQVVQVSSSLAVEEAREGGAGVAAAREAEGRAAEVRRRVAVAEGVVRGAAILLTALMAAAAVLAVVVGTGEVVAPAAAAVKVGQAASEDSGAVAVEHLISRPRGR